MSRTRSDALRSAIDGIEMASLLQTLGGQLPDMWANPPARYAPGLHPRYVFLDKMCIHQTDEEMKAQAILSHLPRLL